VNPFTSAKYFSRIYLLYRFCCCVTR
jgi:hypothetical protein